MSVILIQVLNVLCVLVCCCRRKNVGFLYALTHGASSVYDADEHSTLLQNFVPSISCQATGGGLINHTGSPCVGTYAVLDKVEGIDAFNPYPLFGQPHIPRGMPIRNAAKDPRQLCFSSKVARPLIQQSLTNGYPDILQTVHGQLQRTYLDNTAFPFVLPAGVATPVSRYAHRIVRDTCIDRAEYHTEAGYHTTA